MRSARAVGRSLTLALVGSALLALPRLAAAQTSVGGYIGAEFDNKDNWFLFGAEGRIPIQASPTFAFDFNPRFTYHSYGSGAKAIQIDANALYYWELVRPKVIAPYVGLGAAFVHFSGDDASQNKVGLNLLMGTKVFVSPTSPLVPFVNAQYTFITDYPNSYTIVIGASYNFHKGSTSSTH